MKFPPLVEVVARRRREEEVAKVFTPEERLVDSVREFVSEPVSGKCLSATSACPECKQDIPYALHLKGCTLTRIYHGYKKRYVGYSVK